MSTQIELAAPPAAATSKPATPIRLPDHSWGAIVDGVADVGDRVQISARNGKRWLATVTAVVARMADGRTMVETRGDDPPTSRPRSAPRSRSRSTYARIGGRDYFQNAKGRCEDAPCCGCCS